MPPSVNKRNVKRQRSSFPSPRLQLLFGSCCYFCSCNGIRGNCLGYLFQASQIISNCFFWVLFVNRWFATWDKGWLFTTNTRWQGIEKILYSWSMLMLLVYQSREALWDKLSLNDLFEMGSATNLKLQLTIGINEGKLILVVSSSSSSSSYWQDQSYVHSINIVSLGICCFSLLRHQFTWWCLSRLLTLYKRDISVGKSSSH